MTATTSVRPILALAMGDPCGISPELTAKLINDAEVRAAAALIVIGDRRVLAEGEATAKLSCDMATWTHGTPLAPIDRPTFVDLGHLDPKRVTRGVASREGGTFAMANFRTALRLANAGVADAMTFTPFNKHAMKLATGDYEDEIAVITEETGANSPWPRVQYSRQPLECPRHQPHPAEGRIQESDHRARSRMRSSSPTRACARPALPSRASPSPPSIRMPAKAATSAARRSTSSSQR